MAQLLAAAAAVLAVTGYEAATMSAIAERAEAPIGSLYQFYPNKRAITHALRTQYGSDYEVLLIELEKKVASLSLERLAAHLVRMTVDFVESHPAFLALLDAPSSTRSPVALRRKMRLRLAACFAAVQPELNQRKALQLATVTLQLLKGLNQLYGEVSAVEKKHIVQEYRTALSCYLAARLGRKQP